MKERKKERKKEGRKRRTTLRYHTRKIQPLITKRQVSMSGGTVTAHWGREQSCYWCAWLVKGARVSAGGCMYVIVFSALCQLFVCWVDEGRDRKASIFSFLSFFSKGHMASRLVYLPSCFSSKRRFSGFFLHLNELIFKYYIFLAAIGLLYCNTAHYRSIRGPCRVFLVFVFLQQTRLYHVPGSDRKGTTIATNNLSNPTLSQFPQK